MSPRSGATPISPAPVADDRPDHLPAYLSNGVVGLRVRSVPLRSGLAVVSGLEGEHATAAVASVPPVPYPLAGDIKVGPVWMSNNWHNIHDVVQRYDFETGELHSAFVFSCD